MQAQKVNVVAIMEKVREQFAKRGARTIRGLGRAFRLMDSYDGNRKVDAQEFFVGMQEAGIQITKVEADALMSYFDTDGDGHINYDEFLVGIRVSCLLSQAFRRAS